jgi:mannose-6-phosphate isomerase-like protein (cupin superfamily)
MQAKILNYDSEREYLFREGCFINELSNSDKDPALSIARVRVGPGDTTRWHRLSDTAERYVILQGTGEVEIGERAPQRMAVGDVALIPPGCRQRIRNTGADDLVFLALCTPRFDDACYLDEP